MDDMSAVDTYLAEVLRALRAGNKAPWHKADEADVWGRIEFHGIAEILHRSATDLDEWPDALLARIGEEARLMGLWEETHRPLVARLLRDLARAGLDAMLMKGTVLAYSLYDEPASRRRGDSDVLINPRDLDRVREVLKSNGWYRANDPHGLYFQEGWLHDAAGFFQHALDLHWETSDRPVLQRVLDRDAFFAGKVPLDRLGEGAFGSSLPQTLIHCAINQNWHVAHGYWAEDGKVMGTRRLIWSLDFDLMMKAMTVADWADLLSLCEAHGIGPLVATSLRDAESDLRTPLPADAMVRLDKMTLSPEIARCLDVQDGLGEFWHDFKTAHSWGDRRRMLLSRGFPPREHLLEKYPDKSGWPTILLQGRMMIETAGRLIKRAGAQ